MIVLCSFANSPLKNGFKRLREQATSFRIFDEILLYTETDLEESFRKRFGYLLRPYSKGYGYWCWKPQVIMQTLELMKDGDVMLYMDTGSHLNVNGKCRFLQYLEIVNKSKSGILAFRSPVHVEKKLTKRAVLNYFRVENNKQYTDSTQIEATYIIIRKCNYSVNFIGEWLNTLNEAPLLFTDESQSFREFKEFKAHRHDQSIFSILGKKYGIDTLYTDETYSEDWTKMNQFPLLSKRDKLFCYKWQHKYYKKISQAYKLLWLLKYGKYY